MRLLRPGTQGRMHAGKNVDPLGPVGMARSFHNDDVRLPGGEWRRPRNVACKLAVDIDLGSFGLAQFNDAEFLARGRGFGVGGGVGTTPGPGAGGGGVGGTGVGAGGGGLGAGAGVGPPTEWIVIALCVAPL